MKSEKIIRPCGAVLLNSNCFDVKDGVVRQMRWCQKVQDYYFDNPCRECPKKGQDKKKDKKRVRIQIPFNTGQRVHKSKKDYKRNKKVDLDDE